MLVLLLGVGQAWGQTIAADQLQYYEGVASGTTVTRATNINNSVWYVIYQENKGTRYYWKDNGSSLTITTEAPVYTKDGGYLFNISNQKVLSAKTGKYLYMYINGVTPVQNTNSNNSTTFTIADGIKFSAKPGINTYFIKRSNTNIDLATRDNGNNSWTLEQINFTKKSQIKFLDGHSQEATSLTITKGVVEEESKYLTAKATWTGDPSTSIGSVTYTSSNTSVAEVASNGRLTIKAVGTTTITARFSGTGYTNSEASYTLTVKKKDVDIKFFDNSNVALTEHTIYMGRPFESLVAKVFWDRDENTVVSTNVTYTVNPESTDVVGVNASTGVLEPHKKGTAYINAIYAGDGIYSEKTDRYYLHVEQMTSTLSFANANYEFPLGATPTVAASLIWSSANGGDNQPIGNGAVVTYSSDDESVATVDDTGKLTLRKEGTCTITAHFDDSSTDVATACADASYTLTIGSNVHIYNIIVAGGPHEDLDPEAPLAGRAIIGGTEYENGEKIYRGILYVADVTAKNMNNYNGNGKKYRTNITISELIDNEADVRVNYAEIYDWQLNINRTVVDNDDAHVGTNSSTGIVVYISGKPYRNTQAFESTVGEMALNFVTATHIRGYEAVITIDNEHRTINVTYRVYTHVAPQQSCFIRLRNYHYITPMYISHDKSEAKAKVTEDANNAIIYYERTAENQGKFLFYNSGLYLKPQAEANLAAVGGVGEPIQFSNEGNTEYFNVKVLYNNNYLTDGTGNVVGMSATATSDLEKWYIEELSALPVTITSTGHGYATLYCPVDLEVPVGVKAYVATERNGGSDGIDYLVTLKRLTNNAIPKNTPVILFSEQAVEQNTTFYFPIISGVEDISSSLWTGLTGTCPTINRTEGDYALQPTQGSNTVGFYPWTQSTLSPFKAYIPATVSPAKYRFVFDDDDISAIDNVAVDAPSLITTRYYNINGVQMAKPLSSGVTIVVDCYSDGTTRSRKIHRK